MGGWTYMLRCCDESYYVGSTSHSDVHTRLSEHNDGAHIGSYTYMRRPVVLVWSMHFDKLTDAHETERRVKGWSRSKKEALIAGNEEQLLALSVRRRGLAKQMEKQSSRRELAHKAQSIGAKNEFVPPKRKLPTRRKPHSERPTNRLIPPNPRHPEVRAERAPKDE
ncbi:MAG: GIY-YIG nuclease family protein [Proteobacteria bacterium]|nr:GIY-YIG nuclease family protein [Pseudomonadota bacterium]